MSGQNKNLLDEMLRRMGEQASGGPVIVKCGSCGQKNKLDIMKPQRDARCGKCGLPIRLAGR